MSASKSGIARLTSRIASAMPLVGTIALSGVRAMISLPLNSFANSLAVSVLGL